MTENYSEDKMSKNFPSWKIPEVADAKISYEKT